MIKKTVFILIVIMFVSFIASGVLFVASGGMKSLEIHNLDINEEAVFNQVDTIQEIYISSSVTDVTIINTDNDEIKFNLYGHLNGIFYNLEHDLKASVTDGKINVEAFSRFHGMMVLSGSVDLNVYLPKSYTNKLVISTTTGDVIINDRQFNALTIDSTTGDLTLNTIKTNQGNLLTTTGDIDGTISGIYTIGCTTGDIDLSVNDTYDLNIDTTTGDVTLRNVDNSDLDIHTTTGDINKLTNFSGTQSDKLVNGLIGQQATNRITISTTTGDIEIN